MDNLGDCYISISLASDTPFHKQYAKTNSSCGIDLNLSNFLTDSDGDIIESPKYLKRSERKLKKAQRKLSRKYDSAKKMVATIMSVKAIKNSVLK